MSPASSGHLEVERYIGACLISQHRSKNVTKRNDYYVNNREQYVKATTTTSPECFQNNFVNLQRCNSSVVDGWAGGMPLISFANHQRRNRQQQQQINDTTRIIEDLPPVHHHHHHHQCSNNSPLARLAVHTQGAPLILTKTYNHRKNKVNRNNNNNNCKTIDKNNKVQHNQQNQSNNNNNDTVSVASDESSSGSTNSENCLPRIIKPRKRRKKDRKPPPLLNRPLNSSQDGFSTDSASPDIDLTNVHTFLPLNFPFDCYLQQQQQQFLPQQQQQQQQNIIYDRYRNNIKYNDNSETPKLHHSFDDIKDVDDGKDINGNQPTSVCQCRYCDPSGQIWDVDRNCYSPFLTPPNDNKLSIQYPSSSSSLLLLSNNTKLKTNYLTSNNIADNYNLICNMSALSIMDDAVVVVDEEEDDGKKSIIPNSGPREVEVSTEIVTSLNGHRDLEIKFFSTTSCENVRPSTKDFNNTSDSSKNDNNESVDDCEINCAVSVNKSKLTMSEEE